MSCLGAAVALAVGAAWLSAGSSGVGTIAALARFVVVLAAVGAAIATWATAVIIASVHRVVWPLVTATVTVVAGVVTTAAWWISGR